MASSKNPGTKLYFSRLGGEQAIPPKFLAAMERKETRQAVNNDIDPEPLSDEIVESEVSTDRTNERVRRTVKKKPGNIVLRDIRTNDQGQPVQVVLTLFRTNDSKFERDVPTLTRTTATEDLGNGWSIQETLIEGRYGENGEFIEEPFQNIELATERNEWVPDKFGGVIERQQTQEIVSGTVAQPTLGANDLRISERQLSLYKKLVTELVRTGVEFPVVLVGKRTNQQKQVVTVTETLRVVGTAPEPSATQDSIVQTLGNGYEVVITEVVSEVFPDATFTKQVDDAVPLEFRVALPTTDSSSVEAGSAIMPTLGSGDLLATQKQLTEFTKLVRLVTRSGLSLPVTLVGKDTNDKGQIVTITRTYRVVGNDPVPTATKEVAVQVIGDGNVVETTREITAVFGAEVFTKEIPDVLDPAWRALLATESTEEEAEGTATTPTLGATDLSRTETQVTSFVKKVRRVFRSLGTLPRTLTDKFIDGLSDNRGSKFTGLVTRFKTLAIGAQTPDQGFLNLSSVVNELGDGKTEKKTETIDTFPTFIEHTIDNELSTAGAPVVTTKTKTIIPAGTAHPGGFVEQYPLDKERTERISESHDTTALTNYKSIFEGTTNIPFPTELTSVTGITEEAFQDGGSSHSGFTDMEFQTSGSVEARLTSEGSAAITHEVNYTTKQYFGSNAPCTHYLFIAPTGTSRANILTKLHGLGAINIADWPRWNPREDTLVCRGASVSAKQTATAQASAAVRTNYNGDAVHGAVARQAGYSNSGSVTLDVKVFRFPPIIHGALTISSAGPTQRQFSTFVSVNLGVVSVSPPLLIGTAISSIKPTSLTATSGNATLPASGLRLYRLTGEPYSKNAEFVKYHAEVVNFALLTEAT